MITKGKSRKEGAALAQYLLELGENDQVFLGEIRGTLAQDLEGALVEMEEAALAASATGKLKKAQYHAQINPDPAEEEMTPEMWQRAIEVAEQHLGLDENHARAVVFHEKKGRLHAHVVWSRLDSETMQIWHDGMDAPKLQRASRQLEQEFGHRRILGAYELDADELRPTHAPKPWEVEQGKRTKIEPRLVYEEVRALRNHSDNRQSFFAALEDAGYQLANGDQRVFVIVDQVGGVHAMTRVLGLKAKELYTYMDGVDREQLPTVAQVRAQLAAEQKQEGEQQQGQEQAAPVSIYAPLREKPAEPEEQRDRQMVQAAIKTAWRGAERDPLEFAIGLGEEGLTLARTYRSNFVAVDMRGDVHQLTGAAMGDDPRLVKELLREQFGKGKELDVPSVSEVRAALRAEQEWKELLDRKPEVGPALGKVDGEIRLARQLTGDRPNDWAAALDEKGLYVVRATKDEIKQYKQERLSPLQQFQHTADEMTEHELWMNKTGGYEKLSARDKAKAEAAFEKWQAKRDEGDKRRNKGEEFGVEDYVSYVQRQWQKDAQGEQIVVVNQWGNITPLSRRNMDMSAGELNKYLAGLSPESTVTLSQASDLVKNEREEWKRAKQWERRAPFFEQQREKFAESKTARAINWAWYAAHDPQSLRYGKTDFIEELNDQRMILARATAEEAAASQAAQFEAKARGAERIPAALKEGSYYVVDRWGKSYGTHGGIIHAGEPELYRYFGSLEAGKFPSVTVAQEMQKARREEERAQWDEERRIERLERRSVWVTGETVDKIGKAWADTESAAEFMEELKRHNIYLARVSVPEAERSEKLHDYLAMTQGKDTPVYEAAEYVAVNEHGRIYRLDAGTIYDHEANITTRLSELNGTENIPSLWDVMGEIQEKKDVSPTQQSTSWKSKINQATRPLGKGIAGAEEIVDVMGGLADRASRITENVMGALVDFFTTPYEGPREEVKQQQPTQKKGRAEAMTPAERAAMQRATAQEAQQTSVPVQQARTQRVDRANMPQDIQDALRRAEEAEQRERRRRAYDSHEERDLSTSYRQRR